MARDYIGIRMGPDLRAQVEAACIASGLTLSEWIRLACVHVLDAGAVNEAAFANEGFQRGREVALMILRAMLNETVQAFPATLEDAIARFPQLVGGASGGGVNG